MCDGVVGCGRGRSGGEIKVGLLGVLLLLLEMRGWERLRRRCEAVGGQGSGGLVDGGDGEVLLRG